MVNDEKTKKVISELAEKIVAKYTPKKIVLFGSYAYGAPDKHSDIDMLIIKDTSEPPLDRMVEVHRIVNIRDSSYPAFSPIVLTSEEIEQRLKIGDQFIKEILRKGEVLYDR